MLPSLPPLRSDEVPRRAVRLLVVGDEAHRLPEVTAFAELPRRLRAGDLLVVNDAATLPASLRGRSGDGAELELRLSTAPQGRSLHGVLLGPGDHRTRTEHRPPPPELAIGERVVFAPQSDASSSPAPRATAAADRVARRLAGEPRTLTATVVARRGRLVELRAEHEGDALWQALYACGAPVQYAHRTERLPLGSVQTAYAARPWAAEMPSAGRPLTWEVLVALRRAGVELATLTHAAGLSATGEPTLDAALPWPERYELPTRTAAALVAARARGGRVIAVGTTVVRALEASQGQAGVGVATLRLVAATTPRLVDAVLSGLHIPGESHFDLLTAFAPVAALIAALERAAAAGLSSHELGDSCLVWRTT